MKIKRILYVSIFFAWVMCGTGCVDQSSKGQDKEERTVVGTSVTICEILDALEIDEVIGVPDTTGSIPRRYHAATTIGAAMNPDMEILSSLAPTYVISPKSLESDLRPQYENSGLDNYFVDLSSLEGMYQAISELGVMFGKEVKADTLNEEFKQYLESYAQELAEAKHPRVLILMGLPGSYVVGTNKSYIGNLVEYAGGENVYAKGTEAFLNINPEDMIKQQPDVILLAAHALPEQVEKMFAEEFAKNDIWKHFDAVNNQRVYTLNHQHFGMSANLHYQAALYDLKELLHEKAK